jgi:hypothetical protein
MAARGHGRVFRMSALEILNQWFEHMRELSRPASDEVWFCVDCSADIPACIFDAHACRVERAA